MENQKIINFDSVDKSLWCGHFMKSLWQKTETLQKIQMFINSCLRQHMFKIRWLEKVKMKSFGSQAQEPMEKTNPKALVGVDRG